MPNGIAPTISRTTAEAALQITRANAHWGPTLGQPATVTYAFRDFMVDGYQMDPVSLEGNSFMRLNGGQIAAVQAALQLWSDVANINFQLVRGATSGYSNDATMLFGTYLSTADNSAAFARFPGAVDSASRAGDVWLNRATYTGNGTIAPGTYAFEAIIHEIGHAIGLQHPADYDTQPTLPPPAPPPVQPRYTYDALYVEDHQQYTIMSYFTLGAARNIESPLLHDVAAAQRLYGANLATRLGDDVYGFNATIQGPAAAVFDFTINQVPNIVIYDAGGTDTFDASGFVQNQVIDLRPGFFSSVGPGSLNVAMAATVRNAAGQVVNWIENAVGGSGADTLVGNDVSNVLEGRGGADSLVGGGGLDYAGYARAAGGVVADLTTPSGNTRDAAGDRYVSIEGLIGSAFADRLRGDAANNRLYGDAGADTLDGGGGVNKLYGEAGNDVMVGRLGDNAFDGGADFDIASYELSLGRVAASLTVGGWIGDASGDTYVRVEGLRGSAFDDTLSGGAGNDRLEGGQGNDRLDGLDLNDTMSGGEGNDTFRGGHGADSMNGGDGIDTADYSALTGAVRVVLGAAFSPEGTPIVSGGLAAGDRFTGVENVIGTSFADTIYGNAAGNLLAGGAEYDLLRGGTGNDTYDIGAINDLPLAGRVWDDVFEAAGEGFDTVLLRAEPGLFSSVPSAYYTLGANVEAAEAQGVGNFTLVGNVGDNRLIGSTGSDRLVAGDGADTLGGGGGGDTLFGEFGNDTYLLTDVNPTVFSLAEWDSVLEPVGGGTDTVILVAAPHPTLPGVFRSSHTLGANVENGAVWDARDFTLVGNVLANRLWGGSGHDRLVAGDAADTLEGGAGADTLFGEFGNDVYVLRDIATPPAPPGSIALAGWDLILEAVNGGTDLVLVERAAYLLGGVTRWRSDYTLADLVENGRVTGSEAFTLTGNTLDNRIEGNAAGNFLLGQDGADTLTGYEGNDALNGGFGNDRLSAGADADTLDGAAGRDTLTGGTGADRFVIGLAPATGGPDSITDFEAGLDQVVVALAAIDPGGTSGLAAGSLAGQARRFYANAGGQAGQPGTAAFIYETDVGRLWWDADGLGGAAARVHLASFGGLPALAAADIVIV